MHPHLLRKTPFSLINAILVVIMTSTFCNTSLISAYAISSNFSTATPIKHLVIIFQENVSFDHYFATYPNTTNLAFHTSSVNGLNTELLTHNPNLVTPFMIPRSKALTCSNDHSYARLQEAYNGGLVDKFVKSNLVANDCNRNITIGYFDGSTVTALWNYAQHFAMSDNYFGTTFGPSTVGALNLVSGQTHGATPAKLTGRVANGTVIGDPDPAYDDCSNGTKIAMSGSNIGTLLNSKNITWGWFQGGFKPTGNESDGRAQCESEHPNISGENQTDYIPHHEPFQYYNSTSNPHLHHRYL